ncbi:hypothetical protein [Streptomyces boluensis]|uniref:Uncharacterized protein n=1 Tax=Streptomyces boluensis TaxID=1775135 RepID=A0A964USG4_9ACTN|nr:hypothetical protein [Streptomyces boluensis]NBE53248.1 hypothetical protein [Streptomyces boluensis]
MPFEPHELRVDLTCAHGDDGHWRGWFEVSAHADALRRLGLHPGQETAQVTGPAPPLWWHAAAERRGW